MNIGDLVKFIFVDEYIFVSPTQFDRHPTPEYVDGLWRVGLLLKCDTKQGGDEGTIFYKGSIYSLRMTQIRSLGDKDESM
jgi:hypothetical protein